MIPNSKTAPKILQGRCLSMNKVDKACGIFAATLYIYIQDKRTWGVETGEKFLEETLLGGPPLRQKYP
jgi:hypothetical protein